MVLKFLYHPLPKFVDNGQCFFHTKLLTLLWFHVFFTSLCFYRIKLLNIGQCFFCPCPVFIYCYVKLSACVRPAIYMSNTFSLSDFILCSISIGLKVSFKSLQYILGSLGTAARLIIKKHGFIHRIVVQPLISLLIVIFFFFFYTFNFFFFLLFFFFIFSYVCLFFIIIYYIYNT